MQLSFGIILCGLLFTMSAFGKDRERVASPSIRTTITGAVFKRDSQYPKLGEAYRDPSGLIWGQAFEPTGHNPSACQRLGFRGPTVAEFINLARYLGQESDRGYSPKTADGLSDVLPFLSGSCYFPYASRNFIGDEIQMVFCGDTGEVYIYGSRIIDERSMNVICVAR